MKRNTVSSAQIYNAFLRAIPALALALLAIPGIGHAQQSETGQRAEEAASIDQERRQPEPDTASVAPPNGEEIFRSNCMACHMADGRGAEGAGRFPALAENSALTAAGYPIFVVLNGLGGMPWFNGMLSDEEIAAVVTYIRTHFGNNYTEPVKPEDVALMRGPVPQE